MNLERHRNALLERHRCGHCAEKVPASSILRSLTCEFCGQPLIWTAQEEGGSLYSHLQKKWRGRKWLIVILVAISSLFSGQIPMLQSIVMIVALLLVHVFLIRKSLNWFPMGRRIPARITIQLLASMISVINLVLNALVSWIVLLGGVFLSVLSVVNLLVFIHGSMYIIRQRLRWEEDNKPVGIQDWWIPALFFGFLLCFFVGIGLSFYTLVELFNHLSVQQIYEWL